MKRTLFAWMFAFTATGANAIDMPWQESAVSETPEYCKGFVIGGLASKQVAGTSRTDLWLAWNHVIRHGALNHDAAKDEYQAGWEQFQNIPNSTDAQSVVQNADGECGLGRTGLQITGW
jgi:hypothetical protein